MDFLTLGDKLLPNLGSKDEVGKALRVVNISNTTGNVKVTGGNDYIYESSDVQTDINNIQYRRKGESTWKTVPYNTELSCAQGAYIDFRYKNLKGE